MNVPMQGIRERCLEFCLQSYLLTFRKMSSCLNRCREEIHNEDCVMPLPVVGKKQGKKKGRQRTFQKT